MIFNGSRYMKTPPYMRGGKQILAPRVKKPLDIKSAMYHTVVEGDTLDGISFRYYNRTDLGWAILDSNPTLQTELDLVRGLKIAIPEYTEVVKSLC